MESDVERSNYTKRNIRAVNLDGHNEKSVLTSNPRTQFHPLSQVFWHSSMWRICKTTKFCFICWISYSSARALPVHAVASHENAFSINYPKPKHFPSAKSLISWDAECVCMWARSECRRATAATHPWWGFRNRLLILMIFKWHLNGSALALPGKCQKFSTSTCELPFVG